MSNTTLSVSILNGHIKAAGYRRGSMTETWDGPQSLVDFAGLAPVLREAAAKTRSTGKTVSVVFADPRLSDQFADVPETRGGTLRRLLERQAQRLKAFPEPAVWSAQPALPSKNGKAILLHLCPKPLLNQIARSCFEADLQLVRLLPTTAVLVAHLKSLPLQKDEVALLAAETGRSTTLVIGRKDGRICLGRVLAHTWNSAPDKVSVDLTRSIGFAEQQSGFAVTSAWLFGEGAEQQVSAVQSALKVPVKVSPVPHSPHYWAEQAVKLPEKDDGNLVSPEMREAPQRQRIMTVTAMLVALLVLGSVVAAGVIEFVRRNEVKGIAAVKSQISELNGHKTELEKTHAELEKMRHTTEFVQAELPPAPSWFLSYLGQVMPGELALTQLRVFRTNDLWSVQMSGIAESRTNIAESLNSLSNNLAVSSFKLQVTECSLGGKPNSVTLPSGTGSKQLTSSPSQARRDSPLPAANTFVINGTMQ
jgi:hypothetical protein